MATTFRNLTCTVLALVCLTVLSAPAFGQFLCSAGSRDGQDCDSDDDCTGGGVCVLGLGVCNGGTDDGLFCDCPEATCTAEPVCSFDGSLGTCAGGTFDEFCCDLAFNCFDGAPCAPTQKVCLSGANKGNPCLRDSHCGGNSCVSTGRFCSGGDFDSFSCVDTADCSQGGGVCVGALATPSPTRTRTSTPVPSATVPPTPPSPTTPSTPSTPVTPPTGVSTRTPTPTRTLVLPSATAQPTSTPRPTDTPVLGRFVMTAASSVQGDNKMQVVISQAELETFPVEGVVQVFGQTVGFTRRRPSTVLNLADGLSTSVPAGTAVLLIPATPRPNRPGGTTFRNEQGGTCAILPASSSHQASALPLVVGLGLLVVATRRRR